MIRLATGGHYRKKGYQFNLFLVIPEFRRSKTKNLFGQKHSVTKISLGTKFCLTDSPSYVNIILSVLGFGLCLEIHSKPETYQGEISE